MADCIDTAARFLALQEGAVERALTAHRGERGRCRVCCSRWPCTNATKLGPEVDLHARHHRRSQGHEMILEDLNLVALGPAQLLPSRGGPLSSAGARDEPLLGLARLQ